jgi:hypothetical protein
VYPNFYFEKDLKIKIKGALLTPMNCLLHVSFLTFVTKLGFIFLEFVIIFKNFKSQKNVSFLNQNLPSIIVLQVSFSEHFLVCRRNGAGFSSGMVLQIFTNLKIITIVINRLQIANHVLKTSEKSRYKTNLISWIYLIIPSVNSNLARSN